MEKQEDIKLVEVFAGEHWQATMIQNVLNENQIQAFLENELMRTIAPWRIAPGGFNPVKVIVANHDFELSLKLIDEFNNCTPLEEADGQQDD